MESVASRHLHDSAVSAAHFRPLHRLGLSTYRTNLSELVARARVMAGSRAEDAVRDAAMERAAREAGRRSMARRWDCRVVCERRIEKIER